MSADLHVSFLHCRALLEVHAAEDGVFAVACAKVEDSLLNAAFAVVGFGVCRGVKQAELFAELGQVKAAFQDNIAGGYADAPHEQVGIDNAVKQTQRRVGYPLRGGGVTADSLAAVRVLGNLSAVVVGFDLP